MYIYIFFALTYLVDFYDKNRLLNQQINEAHVASQEELQNALKDATEHSLAEAKLKSENTVLKNCKGTGVCVIVSASIQIIHPESIMSDATDLANNL